MLPGRTSREGRGGWGVHSLLPPYNGIRQEDTYIVPQKPICYLIANLNGYRRCTWTTTPKPKQTELKKALHVRRQHRTHRSVVVGYCVERGYTKRTRLSGILSLSLSPPPTLATHTRIILHPLSLCSWCNEVYLPCATKAATVSFV